MKKLIYCILPISMACFCIQSYADATIKITNRGNYMTTEKIVDDFIAAVTRRDSKAVGAMFAKNSEFVEIPGTGVVAHGQEQITALWENFFKDVSHEKKDNRWDIHTKIISGNHAAIERTSYFVFKGKKMAVEMVLILEIENGKIKACRDYCDSRAFIPQEDSEGWKAYRDSLKKLGVTK